MKAFNTYIQEKFILNKNTKVQTYIKDCSHYDTVYLLKLHIDSGYKEENTGKVIENTCKSINNVSVKNSIKCIVQINKYKSMQYIFTNGINFDDKSYIAVQEWNDIVYIISRSEDYIKLIKDNTDKICKELWPIIDKLYDKDVDQKERDLACLNYFKENYKL